MVLQGSIQDESSEGEQNFSFLSYEDDNDGSSTQDAYTPPAIIHIVTDDNEIEEFNLNKSLEIELEKVPPSVSGKSPVEGALMKKSKFMEDLLNEKLKKANNDLKNKAASANNNKNYGTKITNFVNNSWQNTVSNLKMDINNILYSSLVNKSGQAAINLDRVSTKLYRNLDDNY
jgi:hypothetical protein